MTKLTLRSLKRGFDFGETTTLAVQSVSKLTLRSLKRGFVRSVWEVSEQERFNFVFLLAARHSSNKFGLLSLAASVHPLPALNVIDLGYIRHTHLCGSE